MCVDCWSTWKYFTVWKFVNWLSWALSEDGTVSGFDLLSSLPRTYMPEASII